MGACRESCSQPAQLLLASGEEAIAPEGDIPAWGADLSETCCQEFVGIRFIQQQCLSDFLHPLVLGEVIALFPVGNRETAHMELIGQLLLAHSGTVAEPAQQIS